jgi:hypothetical protein
MHRDNKSKKSTSECASAIRDRLDLPSLGLGSNPIGCRIRFGERKRPSPAASDICRIDPTRTTVGSFIASNRPRQVSFAQNGQRSVGVCAMPWSGAHLWMEQQGDTATARAHEKVEEMRRMRNTEGVLRPLVVRELFT